VNKEFIVKKLLLVSGKMRSGKNQFADYLKEEFEKRNKIVKQDLFAYDMKEWSQTDFGSLVEFFNTLAESMKDELQKMNLNYKSYGFGNMPNTQIMLDMINKLVTRKENWYENKNEITRCLLQTYGTQIMRNRVDDNFWIKLAKKRFIESTADIIIVTDVRFPNEIDAVIDEEFYNSYSIRVNRDMDRNGTQHEHESETSLDTYKEFSYIVDNNSDLVQLKESAVVIVNEIESENNES
jgi:hypothetical protein